MEAKKTKVEKVKEILTKKPKAEKQEVVVEDLPTPEEVAKAYTASITINPILKMAMEQAEERRIKDESHGFK